MQSLVPVAVQLLFEISSGGTLVTQAAVEPFEVTRVAEIFVDTEPGNTGVAVANIADGNPILVRFTLKDDSGVELGARDEVLVARGHLAKFVSELFPGVDMVRGSLAIAATGQVILVFCSVRVGVVRRNPDRPHRFASFNITAAGAPGGGMFTETIKGFEVEPPAFDQPFASGLLPRDIHSDELPQQELTLDNQEPLQLIVSRQIWKDVNNGVEGTG